MEPRRAAESRPPGNRELALTQWLEPGQVLPARRAARVRSESRPVDPACRFGRFCANAPQASSSSGVSGAVGACPLRPLQRHLLSSVPAVQKGGRRAALWGHSRS